MIAITLCGHRVAGMIMGEKMTSCLQCSMDVVDNPVDGIVGRVSVRYSAMFSMKDDVGGRDAMVWRAELPEGWEQRWLKEGIQPDDTI